MIKIPKNKVAVIPVFDSTESKGGIIKPSSFVMKRKVAIYEILDAYTGKKYDETDDPEHVNRLCERYSRQGFPAIVRKKNIEQEDQYLDAGERCDQGVVKYIGPDVKDVQIGDYVFFSGYTGTLIQIEGEGRLIIFPESFIECTFDIDKFTVIPGLYFADDLGDFFSATYEVAMNIIASTFTELGKTIDVKPQLPKHEDYNVSK